uniref:Palladin n=1 Tax=Dicentrarchus labrax TaxID=13489 RepID=A0A8P4KDW5_DICLA
MQDGSWNQPLPISLLLKDPAGGRTLEGDGGVFSEASSDGEHYLDSVTELDSGDGDFADLTAFLSADEINRSLDLAREAFGEPFQSEDPGPSNLSSQEQALQHVPSLPVPPQTTVNLTRSPNLQHQTKAPCPDDNAAAEVSSSQNAPLSKSVQVSSEAPTSTEKVVRHKPIQPVYKQDKPRLVHEGLELNDRASSATEFCSRAATFIEELSSIFKGSAQLEQQGEEDSSSPDSGYLSPRSRRPVPQGSVSAPSLPPSQQAETQYNQPAMTLEPQSGAPMGVAASARYQHSGAPTSNGPLSPPCFLQKLKSQEVAEGSPIRLECRVTGNPLPLVRWFCEGRELHNSPDIQIWRDGNLHTLVITEAFEDDTGRYTCVASNSLGADNTSAEVYIEDPRNASLFKCSLCGCADLWFVHFRVQKKTTSMSLTIRSASPKTTEVLPHRSTLVQAMSQPLQRLLQDAQASEGQVVVLECRVRGSPPLQVRWYRQGEEILDSPDFRILQKKPRSAAEPEEICTLVIAEAFPEDGGLFSCIASNPYGSINSTARLTVTAGASNTDTKRWSSCCYQAPSGHQQAASITALIAFPRKSSVTRTPRVTSDSDIQGSKDAVIQDLERKLRFKEERISNGQQRLTYEEKMARRLLGADNAATVLNTQDTEEEPVTQHSSKPVGNEYKVSSFEQRLISEIEFRLERSPVEESDDDVQHDEDSTGKGVAPTFDQKLKHYKVFEGMPVTFSCKVHGDPKPKVYWFKDGKQISKRSEHYRISRDADGTCSLHTAAASLDDDGNYTIMAGNPEGRVSCTGRMMVQAVNQRGRSQRSAPGHMRRPRSRSRDSGDENDNIQERHFRPHFLQAPGDLIVQEGRLCRMDCKVSGLPTPDLIWQLNGQTIRPDSSHKMLVRENGVHSLVIEPVTSRDAGIYTCIASNRAGQNSFNLELIVAAKEMHKAPSFVEKLQNTSVAEGHPVRLECRVTGVPYPQIFWKRENESFTHNTDRISMHQDNCGYLCMIIQPAMKEDAGWYTVSAKNDAGIVSSTARLDVHAQWQQPNLPKPKKVRPSTSRYAALTERGLDVKAAFFPDSSPLQPGGLVESDDL